MSELREWHVNQILYRYILAAKTCLDYKNIILTDDLNYLKSFKNESGKQYLAYCDDDWLVWLSRRKCSQGNGNFNLSYAKYEEGIYYSPDNFFTGLKYLNKFTENNSPVEMKIEMEFRGIKYYMLYKNFTIGDTNSGHTLDFDFDSGNVTKEALFTHKNQKFSTFDKDQDKYHQNCASRLEEVSAKIIFKYDLGWWYRSCHEAHPIGSFEKDYMSGVGINWVPMTGTYASMDWIEYQIKETK